MSRREPGFTLMELLITIFMTGLILAAASSSFVSLLSLSRTQGRIAESNESMVGLELLRRDIESAGTGLFWDDPAPLAYTVEPNSTIITGANSFNETSTGAPRALIVTNGTTFTDPTDNSLFLGSSYLVIKSVNVAGNSAGDKWSYVQPGNVAIQWNAQNQPLVNENLQTNDYVVVFNPRDKTSRPLITGTKFYTTYKQITGGGPDQLLDSAFAPPSVAAGGNPYDTYIVSGITGSNDGAPLRPFNRADYFISQSRPDSVEVPTRCAPNTGILFKAVMTNNNLGLASFTYQPLLDCVADMQVFFGVDSDNDGVFESPLYGGTDAYVSSTPTYTAQQIRTKVKEVRVYILTHEGRKDPKFTYPSASITVGENNVGIPHSYALNANTHYRWKVYRLIAQPQNLLLK